MQVSPVLPTEGSRAFIRKRRKQLHSITGPIFLFFVHFLIFTCQSLIHIKMDSNTATNNNDENLWFLNWTNKFIIKQYIIICNLPVNVYCFAQPYHSVLSWSIPATPSRMFQNQNRWPWLFSYPLSMHQCVSQNIDELYKYD